VNPFDSNSPGNAVGISRQHLYDILEERKPVSPAVAVRLGKLFGDGGVWGAGGSLIHLMKLTESVPQASSFTARYFVNVIAV
jgi:hypothetical protein